MVLCCQYFAKRFRARSATFSTNKEGGNWNFRTHPVRDWLSSSLSLASLRSSALSSAGASAEPSHPGVVSVDLSWKVEINSLWISTTWTFTFALRPHHHFASHFSWWEQTAWPSASKSCLDILLPHALSMLSHCFMFEMMSWKGNLSAIMNFTWLASRSHCHVEIHRLLSRDSITLPGQSQQLQWVGTRQQCIGFPPLKATLVKKAAQALKDNILQNEPSKRLWPVRHSIVLHSPKTFDSSQFAPPKWCINSWGSTIPSGKLT